MNLHELERNEGSKIDSFRKGRGRGTGNGKTAGKGQKGQNSRSGGGTRLGFEGGQNPINRRIPKFGFKNYTRKEFAIVNVESLNKFDDNTIVTPTLLVESGLVKKELDGIKILGNGSVTKKLTVKANKFSKTAKEAIEKVGGTTEVL